MNKATLQLIHSDKVAFFEFKGWFDHPRIIFIAPPWRNNAKDISCIPQGLYNVTAPCNTPDHTGVFRILNVPDRTGILIHPYNYACDVMLGTQLHKAESKGCFGPGLSYDLSVPKVKSSVMAMDILRENIKSNWCMEVRFMLPPEEV